MATAGLRAAAARVVATATLAAVTAWGGQGRLAGDGFGRHDDARFAAGGGPAGVVDAPAVVPA